MENIKNKLIELGGKEWIKNEMERVYISNEILNVFVQIREKLKLLCHRNSTKINLHSSIRQLLLL